MAFFVWILCDTLLASVIRLFILPILHLEEFMNKLIGWLDFEILALDF